MASRRHQASHLRPEPADLRGVPPSERLYPTRAESAIGNSTAGGVQPAHRCPASIPGRPPAAACAPGGSRAARQRVTQRRACPAVMPISDPVPPSPEADGAFAPDCRQGHRSAERVPAEPYLPVSLTGLALAHRPSQFKPRRLQQHRKARRCKPALSPTDGKYHGMRRYLSLTTVRQRLRGGWAAAIGLHAWAGPGVCCFVAHRAGSARPRWQCMPHKLLPDFPDGHLYSRRSDLSWASATPEKRKVGSSILSLTTTGSEQPEAVLTCGNAVRYRLFCSPAGYG